MYGIRPVGRGTPAFAAPVIGSVLLLFFALAVLTPFHFFPFFPLVWVLPFLAMRAIWMASVRSRHVSPRETPAVPGKEQELLEALERRGEITPARAALETSLSVAEADEMLSRLAQNGHVQVHAREGRLAYSMWDMDRRGEIEGGSS